MDKQVDGWLVRTVTGMLSRADSDWAEAVLAELPHVPPLRRTLWALGGLWSLLLRCPATWLVRTVAGFGILWQGAWLWASIGVLTDDAPDLVWPYNLWVVMAQSAVVLALAVALIRPIMGALLGLPVVPWYAWVMWESARVNDGSPPLAVVLFVGLPAALIAAIALLATVQARTQADHRRG